MNAQDVLNILTEAGVIPSGVTRVSLIASATDGYLSIGTEYIPGEAGRAGDDELIRLRQIAQLSAKMVKLQLEDSLVDDTLAEQIQALINPARGQEA